MLVALLAAVVPATFHLGGLDQRLAGTEAGLARVEARAEAHMDAMETRIDTMEPAWRPCSPISCATNGAR